MRNTHIPSILKTVSYNERMQNNNIKIYEIATIFKEKSNLEHGKELKEDMIITICYSSNKNKVDFDSKGSKMNYIDSDIYRLKKYIVQKEKQNSVFHAGQTINYMIGNKKIATLRKSKKTNFK